MRKVIRSQESFWSLKGRKLDPNLTLVFYSGSQKTGFSVVAFNEKISKRE